MFFNADGSAVSRNGQKQDKTPIGGPVRHHPGCEDDELPEVKELKHQQMRPGHRLERRTEEPTETTADAPMGDPDIPLFERCTQVRKTVFPSIWKKEEKDKYSPNNKDMRRERSPRREQSTENRSTPSVERGRSLSCESCSTRRFF